MATTGHTVTAFDDELRDLRAQVSEMGGRAETAIDDAMRALAHRDSDSAINVITNDRLIDIMEAQIENAAIRLIALRSPLADDLREAITALKVAGQIERVGDAAKSIAKRIPVLVNQPRLEVDPLLVEMGRCVRHMLMEVLDAFAARDIELCANVRARDWIVDELHNSLFRSLLARMLEDPYSITAATHLIFVSKNLERIGDHVTNVAEMVHYAVTGEHMPERQRASGTQPA